jgi:hypothetical protein
MPNGLMASFKHLVFPLPLMERDWYTGFKGSPSKSYPPLFTAGISARVPYFCGRIKGSSKVSTFPWSSVLEPETVEFLNA